MCVWVNKHSTIVYSPHSGGAGRSQWLYLHPCPAPSRWGDFISPQRHRDNPAPAVQTEPGCSLELTACEMRRLRWVSWVGTGTEAQSSPFKSSFTAQWAEDAEGPLWSLRVSFPPLGTLGKELGKEKVQKKQEKLGSSAEGEQSQEESQSSLERHAHSSFPQAKGYTDALSRVFEDRALAS